MEEGKETLLAALAAAGLTVVNDDGKKVSLEHSYLVEVEGPTLFKLMEDGYVVGPFGDAGELAGFVVMDLRARGLMG